MGRYTCKNVVFASFSLAGLHEWAVTQDCTFFFIKPQGPTEWRSGAVGRLLSHYCNRALLLALALFTRADKGLSVDCVRFRKGENAGITPG